MAKRVMVIGLDCAAPQLVFDRWLPELPTIRSLTERTTNENLAEGFRWITRLASLAQEWFIEKAVDPLHPVLFRCQDEYRKLMVDNPDVAYWYTVLSDQHAYRIWGTRGDAAYIGFTFGSPMFQGQGKGADGLGIPDLPPIAAVSSLTK